jgi:opacity protein-like surface antigen
MKKPMKKTLSLIAILISLLGSQAYAKTEGNYVGIIASRNIVKIKNTSTLASDNEEGMNKFYNQSNKNSKYGFGFNYKYAFNFNNFFVAPEVSYERLNNEINSGFFDESDNYFSQKLKLKNAITLKSNLGYDINDQLAFYVPIGISRFGYDIETADVDGVYRKFTKKSNNKSATFIGFGLSYEPVKNWILNLEYNKYQNFKLTSVEKATNDGGTINAKTNLDAIKLGLSYRF